MAFPQRHDRRHIDVVEGREHGRGVLGLLKPPRDGLAQAGHRHDFFRAAGLTRRQSAAFGVVGRRPGRLGSTTAGVAFGPDALRSRFEGVYGHEPGCLSRGSGCRSRRRCRRLCRLRLSRRRRRRRRFGLRRRRVAGFHHAQNSADLNRSAGIDADRGDSAIGGRRHFEGHFVGLQFDQRLIHGNRFAGLLQPLCNGRFSHGLAQNRDNNLYSHALSSFCFDPISVA